MKFQFADHNIGTDFGDYLEEVESNWFEIGILLGLSIHTLETLQGQDKKIEGVIRVSLGPTMAVLT